MRSACSPRLALALGRAEIGAEIEQVVLDAAQHGVGFGEVRAAQRRAGDGAARQADHRVGLVDRAVGLDARIVLGHALAAAERGLPGCRRRACRCGLT